LKEIANTLHSLICRKQHASSWEEIKEDDVCFWYLEEQLESCWEEPDHKEWSRKAKILVGAFVGYAKQDEDKNDIISVKTFLNKLIPGVGKLSFLLSVFPRETRFIVENMIVEMLKS